MIDSAEGATGLVLAALLAASLVSPAEAARATPRDLGARFQAALDTRDLASAAALADRILARRLALAPDSAAALPTADSLAAAFLEAGSRDARERSLRLLEFAAGIQARSTPVDSAALAQRLADLGFVQGQYLGRWDAGRMAAQQALAIRRALRGEADSTVAESWHDLARLEYGAGRFAAAESAAIRSLAFLDGQREGSLAAASAWNTRGESARARGDHATAEQSFRRALALVGPGPGPGEWTRAFLLNNLAGVYKDDERFDAAEALLVESLEIRERLMPDLYEARATARLNLAEVHRLQGRLDEAGPDYQQALALATQGLGPRDPALLLFANQYASFARDARRFPLADSLYRVAGAIIDSFLAPGHPLRAYYESERGHLYEMAGRWSDAATAYRSALDLRERALGPTHLETAATCVDLARLAFVREEADSAVLAWLARAQPLLGPSVAFPEARMEARDLGARIVARQGRYDAALATMDSLFVEVDTLRSRRGGGIAARIDYLSGQQERFDRAVGWAVAAGQPRRAFLLSERARARQMLDRFAISGVDFRASLRPDQRARFDTRETEARAALDRAQLHYEQVESTDGLAPGQRIEQLARALSAIDSAGVRVARVLDEMREASPRWKQALSRQAQVRDFDEIERALLRPGRILLSYRLTADSGFVFALLPGEAVPRVHRLRVDEAAARILRTSAGPLTLSRARAVVFAEAPDSGVGPSESLRGLPGFIEEKRGARSLTAAWAVLGSRQGLSRDRLHALFTTLMPSDLWGRVRTSELAIVIPDGALSYLPIEACIVSPPDAGAEPVFWLDVGPPVLQGTSANAVLQLEALPRPAEPGHDARSVLSVCNPARPTARAGSRWRTLPSTEREAERWRAAFGPEHVETLCGDAATESRVRAEMPGHRLLHFALHAFAVEGRGEFLGGLVLAAPDSSSASGGDGFLQANEISELPLDCDLAVLSACETYAGPYERGEGVFSLSRSFLLAGARRVIATLWPVESVSTAELVGELGDALAAVDLSAPGIESARLLRDAKRAVRRQRAWQHPYYWAPFLQSGIP